MPKGKAQRAIMRAQLVITWHVLSSPDAVYNDLGADYYEHQADIRRRARSHALALERLGYKVTIELTPPENDHTYPPIATAS
jgi:hypothetical protein